MKVYLVMEADDPHVPWGIIGIYDSRIKAEKKIEKMKQEDPHKWIEYWKEYVSIDEWDVL